jgi:hypothetical protein
MEARQTLRESSVVPKVLVMVLAACSAVALATGASVIAKDLAGSGSAATGTVHAAPGTILRQDNPPIGAPLLDRGADKGAGPAAANAGRSTGSTSLHDDGNGSLTSYNPGWDARSVREGHGA